MDAVERQADDGTGQGVFQSLSAVGLIFERENQMLHSKIAMLKN